MKRKREKKSFVSFLSNVKQLSTLAVTADVALLAPFGIDECAVSTVGAEVAHHVQEFSKASATVRWPHRLSAAVIAVVTCPQALDAHAVTAVVTHVLVEALGDGVGKAKHAVLPCTLLLAAADALKLVGHFVEAPDGLADSTHVRACLANVEEDFEGFLVLCVVDSDVRHA